MRMFQQIMKRIGVSSTRRSGCRCDSLLCFKCQSVQQQIAEVSWILAARDRAQGVRRASMTTVFVSERPQPPLSWKPDALDKRGKPLIRSQGVEGGFDVE